MLCNSFVVQKGTICDIVRQQVRDGVGYFFFFYVVARYLFNVVLGLK